MGEKNGHALPNFTPHLRGFAYMKNMVRAKIWLAAWLGAMMVFTVPSYAMQACPPRAEMREKAQIIVEARLKSLFIGDLGFVADEPLQSRMVRAELEIQRVIKGEFSKKDAVAFGSVLAPGALRELTYMAMLYGAGNDVDMFELEMSAQEVADGLKFYSLGACVYYNFPTLVEEQTDWKDSPRLPTP
ncbi:hypothetical protein [Agrobacterium larrymoorei]|uniref:hypothetical protein n=1 Tax=Agrobacterium larrymoorei TaxID=160699 RepID=UPI0030BE5588